MKDKMLSKFACNRCKVGAHWGRDCLLQFGRHNDKYGTTNFPNKPNATKNVRFVKSNLKARTSDRGDKYVSFDDPDMTDIDQGGTKQKGLKNVKEGKIKGVKRDKINMVRTYFETGIEDGIAFFPEGTVEG